MSKYYVVFPGNLTFTTIGSAEVWVAPKGTHGEPSEYTGADIVDGIDECTNEPQGQVCVKYDIKAMFTELESQGILQKFLVED